MKNLIGLVFLLILPVGLWGATYKSANFVVEAPTQQMAQQVAQYAEHYRSVKSKEWLGAELPTWQQPCPIRTTITNHNGGGATSFGFGGGVPSMSMHVEGRYDKVISAVLPHEITHTILASHFQRPVPRWADEGASVTSEDTEEQARQDKLCRQILNQGRAIQLKALFQLREYPQDVMALYAQGYSVTTFLVGLDSRSRYLGFIRDGMQGNWDAASKRWYGFSDVAALEEAWLDSLRKSRAGVVAAPPPGGSGALPAATVPATFAATSDSAKILAALERIERGQAKDHADIADIKVRLDRLEGKQGVVTQPSLPVTNPSLPPVSQPPSWNQPPQRTLPPVQQPRSSGPVFAQPTPWSPGVSNCPPGRQ